MSIHWILESHVLPNLHQNLRDAAEKHGHRVSDWNDDWSFRWPNFSEQFVLFHGSLGVANEINQNSPWKPGSFCNLAAFHCSTYYPLVESTLIHQSWQATTVEEFTNHPDKFYGDAGELFVRPDSPLKPFSGRVIKKENASLKALDHGFYYDELDLPIIMTPTREVGEEWRFIVHNQTIITGSGYVANGRKGSAEITVSPAWELAQTIAEAIQPLDPLYVLDIAEANGKLWLMELNPFSGADLYGCNLDVLVSAVDELMTQNGI